MAVAGRPLEPERSDQPIRVLIVEDQHLFADAIRWTLERLGMNVVGVAGTGEQGLAVARRERPDLVLLDLGLPGMSGMEVGRVLAEELPETKVLALTALSDPRAVREALASGFHGYLTKDTPMNQFADSIRVALAGHVVLPLALARAAAGGRSDREQEAAFLAAQLTPRERDVLQLLAGGAGSGLLAARLSIARNTVRTHVQSILTKLQVHSRLEAAAFAVRYGIVDPPSQRSRR